MIDSAARALATDAPLVLAAVVAVPVVVILVILLATRRRTRADATKAPG